MENMILSFNSVFPMFLMIGLGYLAKCKQMISPQAAKQTNAMCFKLFLSVMLFQNIYTSDLNAAFDARLILFCVVGVIAEFFIGLLIIPRFESSNPTRGAMLHAFFRCNFVLMGLPIVASLYGENSTGQVTLLLAVIIPVFNVLAVVSLELFRNGEPNLKGILHGIATNPLIIGAFLGTVAVLTGFRLPVAVESAVNSLAKAATPMTLVLMGATLDFTKLRSAIRPLAFSTLTRLIVNPAAAVALAVPMGFRGVQLCCILLLFATPVATSSYTMALQMDGDADLAAGIVMLTMGLACFTLFFWVWFLKAFNLI